MSYFVPWSGQNVLGQNILAKMSVAKMCVLPVIADNINRFSNFDFL